MTMNRLVTIGVYGYDEAGFFAALQAAHVDTFCDLRRRRAVRGAQYAFANRTRLAARLQALGIRYLHHIELAPGRELRARQYAVDKAQRVSKRQRTTLSAAFVEGYTAECLANFDSRSFVEQLGPDAATVALFCVERDAAACHRSLVAARLHTDTGVEVVDLVPR